MEYTAPNSTRINSDHEVVILKISTESDLSTFNQILSNKLPSVYDEIKIQLKDLILINNPSVKYNNEMMEHAISQHIEGYTLFDYGNWVYYPWSNRMVHLLPKDEFISVRTSRNLYKITPKERDRLLGKRIGIIGLSVGQSVALTIATERICGELVIADYDTLELSNLNRIRTGVHQLGIAKTCIVAREIAEIDPYLKVTCFNEGITPNNLEDFLHQPTKMDILIDECDSLPIKIQCRTMARQLRIPVIMDTSDQGMLDIERFDIEPERALFHGLIEGIEHMNFQQIDEATRLKILAKLVGISTISSRLKASVMEMNYSIRSWPQLASAVTLGGALITETARRILLNEPVMSGRFHIDICDYILPKKSLLDHDSAKLKDELTIEKVWENIELISSNQTHEQQNRSCNITKETIENIVAYACKAPSSGNNQPWLWYGINSELYVFINPIKTMAFGDFKQIASRISIGAALENLTIAANYHGYIANVELLENSTDDKPVARIYFTENQNKTNATEINNKYKAITQRQTSRALHLKKQIDANHWEYIKEMIKKYDSQANIEIVEDDSSKKKLGEIIAEMERLNLLNPKAHQDFYHHVLRWTTAQALQCGDGIDLPSLQLDASATLGLQLLSNPETANLLNNIDGGQKLIENTQLMIENTTALAFISIKNNTNKNYVKGGILMQKVWLYLTLHNIAVQPIVSPLTFFYRYLGTEASGLTEIETQKIKKLRGEFLEIVETDNETAEIITLRIGYAEPKTNQHIRRKLDEVLKF